MRIALLLVIGSLGLVSSGSALQAASPPAQATGSDAPSAGFVFSYRPLAGAAAAFEDGYREHLAWHAERGDSLAWWGWQVLAGPRLGEFVDGVFGVGFAAFDARVDPAGDAENAAQTFQPHAEATGRYLMRLRADLSSATPLEERSPTPLVEVVEFRGDPRAIAAVHREITSLRNGATSGTLLPYTVYESVAGGPPGLVLMIWREGFASFDRPSANPMGALADRLARVPDAARLRMGGNVWLLRRDLSYIPPESEDR